MKTRTIMISLTVIAVGIVGLVAMKDSGQQNPTPIKSELSIASINSEIATGGQFLDVRTPAEYSAGHIKGATNHPLQSIQAGNLPGGALDKPVYVYCQSGNRSAQAKKLLDEAGYINVIDLGSIKKVQAMGGSIES